jgi:hypothetical protein
MAADRGRAGGRRGGPGGAHPAGRKATLPGLTPAGKQAAGRALASGLIAMGEIFDRFCGEGPQKPRAAPGCLIEVMRAGCPR